MKISELKVVGKLKKTWLINAPSLWCQAIREAATPYTSSEILLDVDKEFGTNKIIMG
jgi:hypothetical protein